MNEQIHPEEQISKADKLKVALGVGIVTASSAVEVLGILHNDVGEAAYGTGLIAIGSFYAIKHMPQDAQNFVGEVFRISFLKKKE